MKTLPFCRTVTLVPLHRPKNKVAIQLGPKEDTTDCFKDRAAWLLEGLNASYSHRSGYTLSPARAAIFVQLYQAGYSASWRLFVSSQPVTFSLGDGLELTLKEALSAILPQK
jgi:hypothetical protein